jgi:Cdc6-like AAA superfamily ATPase
MQRSERFTFRKHASIGAAAAEEDAKFLTECFIDNGDLDPLLDCSDRRRIVLGRTGTGKSALIKKLVEETNAIVINPETLSFNYLGSLCAGA